MARYEGLNIQTSQANPGAGSQAMAQQANINVQSITQRLESFSQQAFAMSGQVAQKEAARDATVDIYNRKQKVQKIRDTISDPAEQQAQINKIIEGGAKSDATIYGRAYNTAADSTYANQVALDAKSAADLASIKANGDVEIFAKSFGAFKNSTVSAAPTKDLAILASRAFQQYGSSAFKTIALAAQEKQDKLDKEAYEKTKTQLVQDYKVAIKNNDVVSQQELITKYVASSKSAVDRKFTTPEMIEYEVSQIVEEGFIEFSMAEFDNSDNPTKYLDEFRDNSRLTTEKTEEVIGKMHKALESKINDRKIIEDEEERQHDNLIKETNKSIQKKLVNNELTKDYLDTAFKSKLITTAEYDNYTKRLKTPGVSESDSDEYSYIYSHMDLVTTEQIVNNDKLSREDIASLVNRKEELETRSEKDFKEASDWEGSRLGKQGIGEINRAFKVFSGQLMTKAEMNSETMRDYSTLRSLYFDEMESLKLEERIPQALNTSRNLLKRYNDGEIPGTKPYDQKLYEKDENERKRVEEEARIAAEKAEQKKVQGYSAYRKFFYNLTN